MSGRNHEIRVKFKKEELEKIKSKAETMGLPVSTFIRFICLSANIDTIERH